MGSIGTNWAGNYTYAAADLQRPASVAELTEMVAAAPKVRALGSRHSFSDLTDTEGVLLDLTGLPHDIRIDEEARIVSLGGGVRYGDLAVALQARGWALANLASLPHISVVGAVATGTHGSGDRVQALSGAVAGLDVVGPDGTVRTVRRGEPDFDGWVVAMGALGIVSRVELDIEPTYDARQDCRTGVPWSTVESRLDEMTSAGYSVSMFTRFDEEQVAHVWVKSRGAERPELDWMGGAPAAGPMHMLRGGEVAAITEQMGAVGPWLERLPHFRMEFTPSRGEELQSEWFIPRPRALEAIAALRALAPGFTDLLQATELRTIAADEQWLSGAYRQDVMGFHFTWVRDEPAVRAAARAIEGAFVPLGARPHWGKVFEMDAASLAAAFPRLGDFATLRDQVDPDRVFGNTFLDRVLA